jgi:protein-L-isoaspartate O-methyltransferase
MSTSEAVSIDLRTTENFVDRVFSSVLATYDLFSLYIGDRLGFYSELTDEPLSSQELAARTGTDERYVREWLEHQAVTGFLDAVEGEGSVSYRVPDAHHAVLLDRDNTDYLAAFARFTVGSLSAMPQLLDAFRTGRGVPYRDYGADAREGQADTNRAQFINHLKADWFPGIPDLHTRLQADPPARVADVACGTGWSTISLARAYPKITVDGFDLDEASITLARDNASREDLGDRVTFHVRNAADAVNGVYDLVTVFEAIHDMARPVEALRAIRQTLAPRGKSPSVRRVTTSIDCSMRGARSSVSPRGGRRNRLPLRER